jgi:hypothetical protein
VTTERHEVTILRRNWIVRHSKTIRQIIMNNGLILLFYPKTLVLVNKDLALKKIRPLSGRINWETWIRTRIN